MRFPVILLLVLLAGVIVFYGTVMLASESGEVVTLRTSDAEGNQQATRLWVVDYSGAEWVRTGHPGKGWFKRVESNPRVDFERDGSSGARTAVPVRIPTVARRRRRTFGRRPR